jgi:type VI secretion system secreted protein VgrG
MDTFSALTGPLAPTGDQDDTFRVLAVSGEEALSQLFFFSLSLGARKSAVEAALPAAEIEEIQRALLGARVRFRFGEQGLLRYGIVAAVHDEGAASIEGAPYVRIRVEIMPRAGLLLHRKNSRVFTGKYLHQIVSIVLNDARVSHRFCLGNTYPKRQYCTQYNETDYEFITRLLAEEGILFFFEHVAEFAGGAPPEDASPEETGWDTAVKVIEGIGKGAATAGDMLGVDALKTAGSAASMAADFIKSPSKDDEADDPLIIGNGAAGPGGPGDVLVFIDQASAYREATHGDYPDPDILTVTLRDAAQLSGSIHEISELTPTQRVRADHVEMRDYDFRRPMLVLEAKAATASPSAEVPLEMFDHHSEYEKPEITAQLAQVELEQHRSGSLVCSGQGPCTRLLPGHVFRVENVAQTHLPHDRYAIVRVRHDSRERDLTGPSPRPEIDALARGVAEAISMAAAAGGRMSEAEIRRILHRSTGSEKVADRPYWSTFDCVPATIAQRPPRPVRVPRHVTEVATVVGPQGQDIYTDKYGRIKVQFHWDRNGPWSERSSCWVRVVQPWAGAGFGFQFIPRVGMEVLVTFLTGDPDRPVVLGSLYNATHATPEPLPQRLTRSGFRSQTTPGGGGFNEFSFEDLAGVERIHLHAQKDLHEIVNDTHTSTIKNKQVVTIGNVMEVGVGGDQRWAVGGNLSEIVGKDVFERASGNRTSDVMANRTDRVHGSAISSVHGTAFREVKTDDASVIEGHYNLCVHGDMITQVGGRYDTEKSSQITYVMGSSILTAEGRVLVKAEKPDGSGAESNVRLECGESYIEIGPEKIALRSKEIEIRAVETIRIRGSEASIALTKDGAAHTANPIEIKTPDGSQLVLDSGSATVTGPSGAVVQGSSVALRSGQAQGKTESESDEQEDKTPNLKLRFTHLKQTNGGSPIANTRYRIVAEDQVIEGTTDGDGKVSAWVPDSVRVVYVVLWANERYSEIYPGEEGPLHWLVRIEREVPEPAQLKGARVRLRNLGYDPGTRLDEEAVDAPTRSALLEFQIDQDLPATGELDDATKKKISSIYGS